MPVQSNYELSLDMEQIWRKIGAKLDMMLLRDRKLAPHVSVQGKYDETPPDWWTSGFWAGMLWIMYERTGDERYLKAAWPWDEAIEACFLKANNFHHDVGFQFLLTATYKYKLTGNEDGARRSLQAAAYLAGRFNIKGQFIRAWNQDKHGWSIIDSMMNISLLYWATEQTKDPRYRQIANAHCDTVIRHFQRADGTVAHIAAFDPETGEFEHWVAGQGYKAESAWSRGQSWAIYGFANAYRYTGNAKYLAAAEQVANAYLSALPEDGVPYWDFKLERREGEPKDSSAASCAASGLLELSAHCGQEQSLIYRNAAVGMIRTLTTQYSTLDVPSYEGILLHATGAKPSGVNIDVSLIYGDYFYLECLARLGGWKGGVF